MLGALALIHSSWHCSFKERTGQARGPREEPFIIRGKREGERGREGGREGEREIEMEMEIWRYIFYLELF